MTIWLRKFNYSGELDENGDPCGFGFAVNADDSAEKYEGTWMSGAIHGYCKKLLHQFIVL